MKRTLWNRKAGTNPPYDESRFIRHDNRGRDHEGTCQMSTRILRFTVVLVIAALGSAAGYGTVTGASLGGPRPVAVDVGRNGISAHTVGRQLMEAHLRGGQQEGARSSQATMGDTDATSTYTAPSGETITAASCVPGVIPGWSSQCSGTTDDLHGISCPITSTCYTVGDGGVILATFNGGGRWSAEASGTTDALLGISCPGVRTCYAVGASGMIVATINGGSTWTSQQSGVSSTLRGVSCPNVRTCYAVGGDLFTGGNGILATTDGGHVWSNQSASTYPLYAVGCANRKRLHGRGRSRGVWAAVRDPERQPRWELEHRVSEHRDRCALWYRMPQREHVLRRRPLRGHHHPGHDDGGQHVDQIRPAARSRRCTRSPAPAHTSARLSETQAPSWPQLMEGVAGPARLVARPRT